MALIEQDKAKEFELAVIRLRKQITNNHAIIETAKRQIAQAEEQLKKMGVLGESNRVESH
jgi:hypothetical protein